LRRGLPMQEGAGWLPVPRPGASYTRFALDIDRADDVSLCHVRPLHRQQELLVLAEKRFGKMTFKESLSGADFRKDGEAVGW